MFSAIISRTRHSMGVLHMKKVEDLDEFYNIQPSTKIQGPLFSRKKLPKTEIFRSKNDQIRDTSLSTPLEGDTVLAGDDS